MSIIAETDVSAIAIAAAFECLGGDDLSGCVLEKIQEQTSLTDGCAGCYLEQVDCAAQNCFALCVADAAGEPCGTCLADNCSALFDVCSGLESDDPPACECGLGETCNDDGECVADPDPGACINDADLGLFEEFDGEVLGEYALSCVESDDASACVADLLVGDPGFTAECAGCFGDEMACAIDNCLAECTADDMSECDPCVVDNCGEAFEECSGVPAGGGEDGCDCAPDELCEDGQCVAVEPDPEGQCLGEADLALLESDALEAWFETGVEGCVADPDPAGCIAAGLADDTGLSDGCAGCFGVQTACAIDVCFDECVLGGGGDACGECVELLCGEAFVTCSGLNDAPPGPDDGLCLNSGDLAAIDANDVGQIAGDLGLECLQAGGDVAACVAEGVIDATGISEGCAGCYGEQISCAAAACLTECVNDPGGEDCGGCVAENCGAAFVECSGLQGGDPPPDPEGCLGEGDLAILTGDTDVTTIAGELALECLLADDLAACVADGVAEQTGLTDGCAGCYGALMACAADLCLDECVNEPGGPDCSSCVEANCNDDFIACSGLDQPSPPDAEGCQGDADLEIIDTTDIGAAASALGFECLFEDDVAACVAAGVADQTGLSAGCAGCYGEQVACAASSCLSQCVADPTAEACTSCVVDNCQSGFLECAGFTGPGPDPVVEDACINDADLGIGESTDLMSAAGELVPSCIGAEDVAACVAAALAADTGISDDCAGCFGTLMGCLVDNCLPECSSGDGEGCDACLDDNCGPAFGVCSGYGSPVEPPADCCQPQGQGGCGSDPGLEACVCEADSFCCDVEWDDQCVAEIEGFGCGTCGGGGGCDDGTCGDDESCETCPEDCGPCDPGPGTSCCVAADEAAGCSDPDIESCVCGEDPFCCDTIWDETCVAEVDQLGCGSCGEVPEGACTGSSDTTVLDTADIEGELNNLIFGCFMSPDMGACVADGLASATGLSGECSACFGDNFACVFGSCQAQCSTPGSPECDACAAESCTPAFDECSGLAGGGGGEGGCGDGTCEGGEDCAGCPVDCGTCPDPGTDCCEPQEDSAGCGDEEVQTCVCDLDEFCCTNAWDQLCIEVGEEEGCMDCTVQTGGLCLGDGDSASMGQTDMDAALADLATSCAFSPDPSGCVADALASDPGLSAGCSGCFGDLFGCTVANCAAACSDATDPACGDCQYESGCSDIFDVCSGLGGGQQTSDSLCCVPSADDSPGCPEEPGTEACVCAADPFCCEVTWDPICAESVQNQGCGQCTASVCGDGTCGGTESCESCEEDCGGCDSGGWQNVYCFDMLACITDPATCDPSMEQGAYDACTQQQFSEVCAPNAASPAEVDAFLGWSGCVDSCGDPGSPTYLDCASAGCAPAYAECLSGGTYGTVGCSDINYCLGLCDGDADCTRFCFSDGGEAAVLTFSELSWCINISCQSSEDFEACSLEVQAPGSVCAIPSADCFELN